MSSIHCGTEILFVKKRMGEQLYLPFRFGIRTSHSRMQIVSLNSQFLGLQWNIEQLKKDPDVTLMTSQGP